jgi:outer membrane protein assembly factor BamD
MFATTRLPAALRPRPLLLSRLPHALGAVALVAALGAVGMGCSFLELNGGKSATLTYTEDARLAYNEAMEAFRAKEWENAKALFDEVKRLFPYTRYARLAELRSADIAFEQGKYSDAIAAYRAFVQEHRQDRDVEYARYRITKALYLDVDDTVLLPAMEERDQATTLEAYREIRSYLKEYPRGRYRKDLAYMLDVVTGRLVRHELYVARYYLRSDDFEATLARVNYALRVYPGSGLDPEALVLKGETLLKMHRWKDAKGTFAQVIDIHGGPFAVTAQSFLDEMKRQGR